jgi:hypothetical protein
MKPFWRNKKDKVVFSPQPFLREFMNEVGFRYDKESNTTLKTTDTNKTLYDVYNDEEIFRYVLNFLETTSRNQFEVGGKYHVEDCEFDDVMDEWMMGGTNFLVKVLKSVSIIKEFKSGNLFRDTYKECFLSFKNGVVRITKDSIELKDFDVIGKKYRYTDSLIHKINEVKDKWDGNIKIDQSTDGEFEMLCKVSTSISNSDTSKFNEDNRPVYLKDYHFNEVGFNTLISGIGYLIHRKSDPGLGKLVLLQDRHIDGKTRLGGNGKSLISNALRCIQSVVEIQSDSVSDRKWVHSDVRLGTRTIFYDELNKRQGLTLSEIYTNISSQVVVQRKHEHNITLRGDDVPKLLGGSNFIVFDPKSKSDTRRLHIVEFSDIGSFHMGEINQSWGSEKKLFGMEDDWSKTDWNDFYNFLFRCVQFYLKNGLVEDPNPNWKTSVRFGELYTKYGEVDVKWGVKYMEIDRLSKKHYIEENCPFSFELFNHLKSDNPNTRLDETRMKQMFYDLCNMLGYEYNPSKSHNGDSPNKRKLQRTHKEQGKQLHCLHMTHSKDPTK